MSYSPEQLQAAYKAGYLKATGMDGWDKMDHELRAIEREAASYAATLCQAARVDEDMVERAASAFMRVRGLGMARPWEGMLESSRESYRPAFRAALEAALSAQPAPRAHQWDRDGERCTVCGDKDWMGGPCNGPRQSAQPAERQGEAVAEVCKGAFGIHYIACADPQKLPAGTKLYLHHVAPVGVPDGWKLVPIKPTADMMDAVIPSSAQDQTGRREAAMWSAMLAAAPSAPQGSAQKERK